MKVRGLWVLVASCLVVSAAWAQPPGAPGRERPAIERERAGQGPKGGAGMRQLLEQVMVARLSKALALNDEETVLLVRRFTDFREEVQGVRRKRERAVRELEKAVQSEKHGEVVPLLDRVMALDEELALAKRRLYDHLSTDLPPHKRAALYLWLQDFESDMRRLLQQARRRAATGPGVPPGRPGPPMPPHREREGGEAPPRLRGPQAPPPPPPGAPKGSPHPGVPAHP